MTSNAALSPPHAARTRVGEILNLALAAEFALSAATRDYHWNVTGPEFRSLHELFGEQYQEIDRWSERLGERAWALGIGARTGWRDLVRARRFRPAAGAGLSAGRMLSGLQELHAALVAPLQTGAAACEEQFADPTTAALLSELAEYHETAAWLLGEVLADRELAQA